MSLHAIEKSHTVSAVTSFYRQKKRRSSEGISPFMFLVRAVTSCIIFQKKVLETKSLFNTTVLLAQLIKEG